MAFEGRHTRTRAVSLACERRQQRGPVRRCSGAHVGPGAAREGCRREKGLLRWSPGTGSAQGTPLHWDGEGAEKALF